MPVRTKPLDHPDPLPHLQLQDIMELVAAPAVALLDVLGVVTRHIADPAADESLTVLFAQLERLHDCPITRIRI
jgi:hypothetical protein